MLPEQLRLTDGTIVRRCPTDKPLYCSRAGKFYSVHNMAITDEGCVMHEVQPSFSPVRRKRWRSSNGISGTQYPVMRHFGGKHCHILMALAFYGERPIDPTTGKPCVCHHLIPDPLDYKPANLLCWLSRPEHRIADRRQRALKTVVPDGDLHLFSYERLRELQDPRVTSDEQFQRELNLLRKDGFHRDPRSSDNIMLAEMTHHMEI